MIHNDHVFYIMNTDYLFVFFTLNIFSPAKVLLFYEKAFANRTIRLSNRTNLHFRGILPPILEWCLSRQLFEDAVEGLV